LNLVSGKKDPRFINGQFFARRQVFIDRWGHASDFAEKRLYIIINNINFLGILQVIFGVKEISDESVGLHRLREGFIPENHFFDIVLSLVHAIFCLTDHHLFVMACRLYLDIGPQRQHRYNDDKDIKEHQLSDDAAFHIGYKVIYNVPHLLRLHIKQSARCTI
jgi:hypothetical protein